MTFFCVLQLGTSAAAWPYEKRLLIEKIQNLKNLDKEEAMLPHLPSPPSRLIESLHRARLSCSLTATQTLLQP